MDALIASYRKSKSSAAFSDHQKPSSPSISGTIGVGRLKAGQPSRVPGFPNVVVDRDYAFYVFIPVRVPQSARKEAAQFLKKVSYRVPGLHVVEVNTPLSNLRNDDQKLEQIALGSKFHISLGRTVPIRAHQIDSVKTMLFQKLQCQKHKYSIDFSKWEVFVNDDKTRTFLSIEVISGGLSEIRKQIQAVNEVYRIHNLPEFYKDSRPHISLAWASGDVSALLRRVITEETKKHRSSFVGSSQKQVFTVKFSGIECRIGNKVVKICQMPDC